MKKSLIALAVLGTFAGAASAQSTVTLYGSIDSGVEKVPGSATRVSSGVSKSNRLGFKGTEDLGGGLKASFVIETGLRSDKGGFESHSGTASLGNRATWLSLGSRELGTVSLGRGYAGNFYVQLEADPTGNKFGQLVDGAGILVANNVNSRYDNTIRYQSANYFGFTADVGAGLIGDAQSDKTRPAVDGAVQGSNTRNLSSANKGGYNVGLKYNNGPIYLGAGTTRTPGRAATTDFTTPASQVNNNDNVWSVAGGYDFGIVRISGMAERDTRYTHDKNAWFVAASAPLGSGKLIAFYGQDQNGGGTLTKTGRIGQIAYVYNLSKRTKLYAGFANDDIQGRNAKGERKGAVYGNVDGTTTQFGLGHSF